MALDRARFLATELKSYEAHLRDWRSFVPVLLVSFVVTALHLLPDVDASTRARFPRLMLAFCIIVTAMVVGMLAHRARGANSTFYRAIELIETHAIQAAIIYLALTAEEEPLWIWILYLSRLMTLTRRPIIRQIDLAIFMTPLVVTSVLALRDGWSMGAIYPLVVLLLGVAAFPFVHDMKYQVLEFSSLRQAGQEPLAEARLKEERQRIARNLHDGLASDLTLIAWRLEHMARQAVIDPKELTAISDRARNAIHDTRRVVLALRTESIPWERLCEKVRERCAELCSHRSELRFTAEPKQETTVPGEVAADILYIAQEATRNALHHAAPRRIVVSISLEQALTISVQDDGPGLAPSALVSEGGISNIRSRAMAHGGTVDFRRVEQGFLVAARFPRNAFTM